MAFEVIGSKDELRERAPSRLGRVRGSLAASAVDRRGRDRVLELRRRGAAHHRRRQPVARRRHRRPLDAQVELRPRLLGAVVPGRLDQRVVPRPVPQLVLRPAHDVDGHDRAWRRPGRSSPTPSCSTSTARRCTSRRATRSRSTTPPRRSAPTSCAGCTRRPTRRRTSASATGRATRSCAGSSCRCGTPTASSSRTPASTAGRRISSTASTKRGRCSTDGSCRASTAWSARSAPRSTTTTRMRASRGIEAFVDDLSNWYVRRNRRRFWKGELDADKRAAYATLHEVLTTLCRLLAPIVPHLADAMWDNLVAAVDSSQPDSVHLADVAGPHSGARRRRDRRRRRPGAADGDARAVGARRVRRADPSAAARRCASSCPQPRAERSAPMPTIAAELRAAGARGAQRAGRSS